MACAMVYSPAQVLHLSKMSKFSKLPKLSKLWGEVNGLCHGVLPQWGVASVKALVDDLMACNWGWLQDFWCLKRGQKLLQCNFHQRQICNEVCVTFWDLTIYKYVKILYWLIWLFWLLTWPLTPWFIILPNVLRSLPTSRRDHFLLLCSRELLILAK